MMTMENWTKILGVLALIGSPLLIRKLLFWYDNRRALALRKEIYHKHNR